MLAGGAAIGATAATGGVAVALARRGAGSTVPAAPSSSPATFSPSPATFSPSPAATPPATPTPVPAPAGRVTFAAHAALNFDTFDALRTGEPSVVEVVGRTHSRLVQWANFATSTIGPDLAASWEQPDDHTLVLTLHPAARWHDRPPLEGRPVTAADVVAHLQRALELARTLRLPFAQRQQDLDRVVRVTSPGPDTVVVECAAPDPLLLATLAGRFALVQAPEAVDAFSGTWSDLDAASVVGSGPFVYEGDLVTGGYGFRAFADGHRRPRVEHITLLQPVNGLLDAFAAGAVDQILTRDRRDAVAARALPGVDEFQRLEENRVVSTVFAGAPPWNNPRLRSALSAALNRGELARRLFGGRAVPSGPVPPATPAFALDDAELARFPGYRASFDDDAREARALWEAAGGPALGPVTIDVPSIFDPLYSASSVVPAMLTEVLGGEFRAAIETYTAISAKSVDGSYGNGNAALWFGWTLSAGEPDGSRYLLDIYAPRPDGTMPNGYDSPEVARLLARLETEFEADARHAITRDIARALLADGGGGAFDWLAQTSELFRRRGFHGSEPSPFWPQHLDAAAAISAG